MINWSKEGIDLRLDSENYCGIGSEIAGHIFPYLQEGSTIADCGCGLGHVSLELCRRGIAATAIDDCSAPLEKLKELAEAENIKNLTIMKGNYSALPEDLVFDNLLFCLSGGLGHILPVAEKHCTGKIFIIQNNWNLHRFSISDVPVKINRHKHTLEVLAELNIPYEILNFTQERGQPFRNLESAVQFFKIYDKGGCDISEETVLSKLTANDDPEFPYFMSNNKEMNMIIINKAYIPKEAYER